MLYRGAVIAVRDIKRATAFYQDYFGLKLAEDYGRNVSFTCGLSLQEGFTEILGLPAPQCGAEGFELYFEEDELDEFAAKLSGCDDVEFIQAIHEQPWGQRCLRFFDCDMHIVEVGESMAAAVHRMIDQGLSDEQIMETTMQTRGFVLECRAQLDVRR